MDSVKSNGVALTVNVNAVVCVMEPAVPVTVIVAGSVGADALATNVNVVVQVGEHAAGLNEAVTPAGRPETLKVTDCAAPDESVAVTVLVTVPPWTTDVLPPLVSVKSNGGGLTVSVKAVVCVTDPAVPVTVIVAGPVAAAALAVSVRVVLQVAVQLAGLNEAVTPVGSPDTL